MQSTILDIHPQVEKHGVKINFTYKCMTIAYIAIAILSQLLALAFGFEMMEKEGNENLKTVVDVFVGSVFADGSLYSFFVTYWLLLENAADRIHFINCSLR